VGWSSEIKTGLSRAGSDCYRLAGNNVSAAFRSFGNCGRQRTYGRHSLALFGENDLL